MSNPSDSDPSKRGALERWKDAVGIIGSPGKRKSVTDLENVLLILGATPQEVQTAVRAAETRWHFENSLHKVFNKVTVKKESLTMPKKESIPKQDSVTIPKGNQ